MSLADLAATELAEGLVRGAFTAEAVCVAHLARIAEREPVVHAFAALDPSAAMSAARTLDKHGPRGPLFGLPIAVKDVLDTADLPTGMGSPIWSGHRQRADAACVALARAAGALVLGKTVTAEFAYVQPGPTTNPHNARHTPGGSSSGSAAAVACGMAPLALGTQTGGSILRPAAFCGIIGFKPSYGLIPRAGLKLMSESLDTIGVFARRVADVALLTPVLAGLAPWHLEPAARPIIGLCRSHPWGLASVDARQSTEDAAARLEAAGAELREVMLPNGFEELLDIRHCINDFEIARAMAWEWNAAYAQLSPRLVATIASGFVIPLADYGRAQRRAAAARGAFSAAMQGCDALLVPGAADEAPEGLGSTGDSRFQGIWTLLQGPALGLPTHRGRNGLPLGVQLVAKWGADARLLAVGAWAEAALGPPRQIV